MWRSWFAVPALLVVGTACSPADVPLPHQQPEGIEPFQSGSRLRAQYDELPGGVRVFRGFFDTELGKPCFFRGFGGRSRGTLGGVDWCLPEALPAGGFYAHADCSEPLVQASAATPGGVFVVEPDNNCSDAPAVFALGDEVPAEQTFVYGTDGCVPYPIDAVSPQAHGRGDAIPLDTFVRAEERFVRVGARIGAVVLEAGDGASVVTAGYDFDRGESMLGQPGYGTFPRGHWYPVQVAYNYGSGGLAHAGEVFADSACTRRTANKDAYDASCPITSVIAFDGDGCPIETSMHAAGATLSLDELWYFDEQAGCLPVPPGSFPDSIVVEMLGDVSPQVFAAKTEVEVGSARVAMMFDGTPERQPILASGMQPLLVDRDLDEPCAIARAVDGTRRCLPLPRGHQFLDPTCSTRGVGFSEEEVCGVPGEQVPTLISFDLDEEKWDLPAGEHRLMAFGLGDRVEPHVVYARDDYGVCVPSAASPGVSYFPIEAEVPPDRFEASTRHE